MSLNFGLLQPDTPQKAAESFYRGQQQAVGNQLARQQLEAAQQKQQFNALQMSEMQRGIERQRNLEGMLSGFAPDMPVEKQVSELTRGGFLQEAQSIAQSAAKTAAERRASEKAELETALKKLTFAGQALGAVRDQPSYERAISQLSAIGADVSEFPPMYDPVVVQQYATQSMTYKDQLSAKIDEQRLTNERTRISQDYQRLSNERERLLNENRRLSLDERRVIAAEEKMRLDTDPEHQQRMAAAREAGRITTKNDVAAIQELPKAVARAEQQLQLIDQMIGTQEIRDKDGNILQAATAPHPGFSDAVGVGLGLRFIPGTATASFNAMYDQVKGGAFLEAYEALKGGGAITNIEGEKGTQAITRMSLAQSEVEFIKAARELQEIVRKGVERANKRVDEARKRVGPTPATGAAPAGGGVQFLGFE
jgi:hypothetical protein